MNEEHKQKMEDFLLKHGVVLLVCFATLSAMVVIHAFDSADNDRLVRVGQIQEKMDVQNKQISALEQKVNELEKQIKVISKHGNTEGN